LLITTFVCSVASDFILTLNDVFSGVVCGASPRSAHSVRRVCAAAVLAVDRSSSHSFIESQVDFILLNTVFVFKSLCWRRSSDRRKQTWSLQPVSERE